MSKNRPPSQRQLKAGELIRRALADILAREHLRDPDLKGVSVTISEVRASPDLKHAATRPARPAGFGQIKNPLREWRGLRVIKLYDGPSFVGLCLPS